MLTEFSSAIRQQSDKSISSAHNSFKCTKDQVYLISRNEAMIMRESKLKQANDLKSQVSKSNQLKRRDVERVAIDLAGITVLDKQLASNRSKPFNQSNSRTKRAAATKRFSEATSTRFK